MVKRKAGFPRAPNAGGLRQARETLSYERPPALKAPRRATKQWWQKSEVWLSIAILVLVLGGLAYLGLNARPNTGYPQDDYFVSGGSASGTDGTEGRNRPTTRERAGSDEGFLAFARTQHARSEARAARPSRP